MPGSEPDLLLSVLHGGVAMSNMKVLGISHNACHCEHAECHPNGDCNAFDRNWLVEIYGMQQTLCMPCLEKTRRLNARTENALAHDGV